MNTCRMNFVKYILFAFNLIFAISGLVIIIAGALVISNVSDFHHFTDQRLLGPAIILIITGAIVFIIAFLGCYGAIKESHNLLIAFAALLLLIFILELAVGITAAVYRYDFETKLKQTLQASMPNYTNNKVEKTAWDTLQQKMKCCGIDNFSDWQPLPSSCCHSTQVQNSNVSIPNKSCEDMKAGFVYVQGCYPKLKQKISENTKILIGVGIGVAFVEITGIILACCLAHSIKKEKRNGKEQK